MHHALAIAATPMDSWGERIKALPDGCEHPDCGQPKSCQRRIAEYLRVQYKVRQRLERAGRRQAGSA